MNMEEDGKQASRPSTSKIDERSNNSRHELGEDQDVASNSFASETSVYSGTNDLAMAQATRELSKIYRVVKEISEENKQLRHQGRIQKRRLPVRGRRYKRPTKYAARNAKRNFCQYCGLRCRRRSKDRQRRKGDRQCRGRVEKIKKVTKGECNMDKDKLISACNQAGSRCMMLSPLFLGTNAKLLERKEPEERHCEVSPEMIFEALERLGMWEQSASTTAIANYLRHQEDYLTCQYLSNNWDKFHDRIKELFVLLPIKLLTFNTGFHMHYPVNRRASALKSELTEKLLIACSVGIVTQIFKDMWELTPALEEKKLSKNHVALFWKYYADTMSPIKNKKIKANKQTTEESGTSYTVPKLHYSEDLL